MKPPQLFYFLDKLANLFQLIAKNEYVLTNMDAENVIQKLIEKCELIITNNVTCSAEFQSEASYCFTETAGVIGSAKDYNAATDDYLFELLRCTNNHDDTASLNCVHETLKNYCSHYDFPISGLIALVTMSLMICVFICVVYCCHTSSCCDTKKSNGKRCFWSCGKKSDYEEISDDSEDKHEKFELKNT